MAEVSDLYGIFYDNLKDAGCGEELIGQYFSGCSAPEQKKLLERHRRVLLDSIHREQKKLDCLDYLLYILRKGEENPNDP